MADSGSELPKRKTWFGIDVGNIPCFRESILNGSVGSVVAGVGHFLVTSRVKRSCDVAVGGFILTTLCCWIYCRYNFAKLRMQQNILKEAIQNKILYEGSRLDPEVQNSRKEA